MRCFVAVLFLAACGQPVPFPQKPLPELVAVAPPTLAMAVTSLQLEPGESLLWSVHWKGLTVGRAELAVTEQAVRSRFKTDALASTVVSIEYELDTVIDRTAARAASAVEKLVINGETTEVAETFDGAGYAVDGRSVALPGGTSGHTLHSALGALRAWAAPDARPGFLTVVHAGQPYRLDASQPVAEELQGTETLRVACRVLPADKQLTPFAVTLWLTADPRRTPVRIEITSAETKITAELVDTAAS